MNLTDSERQQLWTPARSRTVRAADVRRAKLIVMIEDGESRDSIMRTLVATRASSRAGPGAFLGSGFPACTPGTPGRAPKQPPARLRRGCPTALSSTNPSTARNTGAAISSLKKQLARDAVGRAHQRRWSGVQIGQRPLRDGVVVTHDVEFGAARRLIHHALRIADLDVKRRFAHP